MTLLLGITILIFTHHVNAYYLLGLDGQWRLKDNTGEFEDIPVTVPGGVYTDLTDNGLIENIYAGFNDVEYKWVARRNWTYHRNFVIDVFGGPNNVMNLILEGIDTVASVWVNDKEIGRTDNMFVKYIFDISDIVLYDGEPNRIEIIFSSPIEVADQLAAQQEENYVIPPECVPESYNGECHVNYLRKVPASFSWDWGPAFPSVGIWKSIYLENYIVAAIRDVVIEVLEDGPNWILSIDTYLSALDDALEGQIHFEIETDEGSIIIDDNVVFPAPNEFGETKNTTNITIAKDSVRTWWPNGYGSQPLYNVTVLFGVNLDVTWKTIPIGFRKIEVVQDELESGLSFYFRVNDVPIFAMGTNVIPFDILPEKSYDEERISRILTDLATYTDINVLRVWGGGFYESDVFYQLADRLGFLVWQDFVFASSMYPANDEFLSNVRREVNHQVKRIQSHTSLALWSGNNENEGNLASNYFQTGDNFDVYKADYTKLYIDTVRDELRRITKNANFIDSSPTNGIQTDTDGYVANDPNSNFFGDKHFYTDGDGFDAAIFPIARFVSEYGFQSLPSVNSWLTVTDNLTDLSLNSDFMKHRQHHPEGNSLITNGINHGLELPSEDNEYYNEAVIYYSQIYQAVATKTETEHYRLYTARLNENGEGYTMGALFWQLNDVWVAPSWSSIDYTGRWKILQYFIPGFFSPELVFAEYTSDDDITIYHVLNQEHGVGEKWINLTVYSYDSLTPLSSVSYSGEFEPLSVAELDVINVDQFLSDAGCGSTDEARYNCFFQLTVGLGSREVAPPNYFYPSRLKDATLQQSNVEITSVTSFDASGIRFLVEVTADAPSLFVWLESGRIRGHFNDNGFNQVSPVTDVIFVADEPITLEELKDNLTVTHLRNPKYFN